MAALRVCVGVFFIVKDIRYYGSTLVSFFCTAKLRRFCVSGVQWLRLRVHFCTFVYFLESAKLPLLFFFGVRVRSGRSTP